MMVERLVFVDEEQPSQYIRVIAAGEIAAGSLDALESFVKRQRQRLAAAVKPDDPVPDLTTPPANGQEQAEDGR